MADYKTPGVYVVEKNSFGSSIVENETAIPIFIGFTEKAVNSEGDPLDKLRDSTIVKVPVLISSMLEFEHSFGGADVTGRIYLTSTTDNDKKTTYSSAENKNSDGTEAYDPGLMYPSVSNYFSNGGGSCYIISLGAYSDFSPSFASNIDKEMKFILMAIEKAETATLILPTDLSRFGATHYYSWGTQFINFCQQEKKYFTIMDVIQSDPNSSELNTDDIDQYRSQVTPDHSSSSYAGAYFPYLKSLTSYAYKIDLSNVYLNDEPLASETSNTIIEDVKTCLANNYINMLPSPYMAGIYARLDNAMGVWTPPANVSPTDVTGPLVPITNKEQETMNVDAAAGKSINAIRSFTGKGTLVWGARTNDGNSLDCRYINVRRLVIAMDASFPLLQFKYVF